MRRRPTTIVWAFPELLLVCLTALTGGGCRTASPAPPVATKPAGVEIRLGMSYDVAVKRFEADGAEKFVCSYIYPDVQIGDGSGAVIQKGPVVVRWYTLRNGMSVFLRGERPRDGGEIMLAGLEVCNSTALFCCKAESWYPLSRLNGSHQAPTLVGLKADIIHKGMAAGDVRKAIKSVQLAAVPVDTKLRAGLPARGAVEQYELRAGGEPRMILVYQRAADGVDRLSLIIVEATEESTEPVRRRRVEFELVNLGQPFGNRSFGGSIDDVHEWQVRSDYWNGRGWASGQLR